MWHIRPQHNPANHLPLPFVPHSSSSIPVISLSLSAVLLHVVLGLPRFRRPSGAQVNAVLQSLFGFFLMMWLMKTSAKYAVNVFELSFVFSINKVKVNYLFCHQGTTVCNFRPIFIVEKKKKKEVPKHS